MRSFLRKLRSILTRKEKRKFVFLLIAFLAMSALDVVGIASILPFMQLVANPAVIETNELLKWLYNGGGFESESAFLIASGVGVLVLVILSNILTVFVTWLQLKLVWRVSHNVSVRLLRKYLYQPYEYFLTHASSDLAKQILSEVRTLCQQVILPSVRMIAQVFVTVVIFLMLLAVDPLLTTVMIVVLAFFFVSVYMGVRKYLLKLGAERFRLMRLRFKTVNESLSGVKAIKMRGSESYFIKRFEKASRKFVTLAPKTALVGKTPKHIIQVMVFGGIISAMLFLIDSGRDFQSVIPILSLYALAGYRLMPSLSEIFSSISTVRYNLPSLEAVYKDFQMKRPVVARIPRLTPGFSFNHQIELKGVGFRYFGSDEVVLNDVNLIIPANATIAFVGQSGSGKTTLVDIVTGLLRPTSGQVFVDGDPLSDNDMKKWRALIGYVPQEVSLFDDTVTRNIVFGIEDSKIDIDRVHESARMANIDEFIVDQLEQGYDTFVGEKGIRLSGGQRQRIGLARAFYNDPSLLILDEATSALDGITEDAIMESIYSGTDDLTVIMIAHRISTVRDCDCIYLMDRGHIVDSGSYDELIGTNTIFRGMAKETSESVLGQ